MTGGIVDKEQECDKDLVKKTVMEIYTHIHTVYINKLLLLF